MIDFKYRINFYTFSNIGHLDTYKDLFTKDFKKVIDPQRYDTIDHPKNNFKNANDEFISNFYEENGDLFIQGKLNVLLWFHAFTKNVHKWTFFTEKHTEFHSLKEFIVTLENRPESLMIAGFSEVEFEAKHRTIRLADNGGKITGAIGVSRQEFRQYLPGLSSFTVFGLEIIQFFTRAKLEGMKMQFPQLEYFEGENYFGFQIDDSQPLEAVIQTQKQIAKYLGQEYFFDRDLVGQVEFKPIPTILEKIG
jgi:hypothetical protein